MHSKAIWIKRAKKKMEEIDSGPMLVGPAVNYAVVLERSCAVGRIYLLCFVAFGVC